MYEEEIHFAKLLFKQSEMVLEHLTPGILTFDPVTPKSIGFLCYPGWMLLIRNGLGTFDQGDLYL